MEHLRTTFACLVGVFAILTVLTVLAISSQVNSPAFQISDGHFVRNDIASQHPSPADASQVPTPAPSRKDIPSKTDNSLHAPQVGQTVYVQIKADHADIEVGWASSEQLER